MKNIKWNDISKYRNELFGIAIISIIIFHYFESAAGADYAGRLIKIIAKLYNSIIGSVGVDIFIFLSGMGIDYSLSKQPNIRDFYHKRLNRVVIPYLILGGVFWIVTDILMKHCSLMTFLYDYSLLSFWGNGIRTFWYISLICLLYAVSPLAYGREKKSTWLSIFGTLVLSVVLYLLNRSYFKSIEVAMLRIPAFFLGMYCGKLSRKKKTVNRIALLLIICSVPLKVITGLTDFPLARMINIGYGLCIILLYICLRNLLGDKADGKLSFLSEAGNISLELYLVHVALRHIMSLSGIKIANPFIYTGCIIISVVISVIFHILYADIQSS